MRTHATPVGVREIYTDTRYTPVAARTLTRPHIQTALRLHLRSPCRPPLRPPLRPNFRLHTQTTFQTTSADHIFRPHFARRFDCPKQILVQILMAINYLFQTAFRLHFRLHFRRHSDCISDCISDYVSCRGQGGIYTITRHTARYAPTAAQHLRRSLTRPCHTLVSAYRPWRYFLRETSLSH